MTRYATKSPATRDRAVSDVHIVTPFSIALRDTIRTTSAGWDVLVGEKLRGRQKAFAELAAFRRRIKARFR